MKLTAAHVTSSLMAYRDFGRRTLCMPRFTPADWWECDLAEISKSDYLSEYEIKLTRQDFRADAKKREGGRKADLHQRFLEEKGEDIHPYAQRRLQELQARQTKFERLAAGDPLGPTRFWYVVPQGLIKLEELPAWAGLLEVLTENKPRSNYPYFRLRPIKDAPRLHRQKVRPEVVQHLKDACYYRFIQRVLVDGHYRDCPAVADQYAPPCSSTPPSSSSADSPCWSGLGSGI